MRYYDVTIRVSADAVREAQGGPESPGLAPHETITAQHLTTLGETLVDTVKDLVDDYQDITAHVSSVAGPFNLIGGPLTGITGPLATISALQKHLEEARDKAVELEREQDRILEELLERAPKCWSQIPRPLDLVGVEYLRALEAHHRSGRSADARSGHDDFCDGTCS